MGVATALIVGAGISAAAQMYGAHKSAQASKEAAAQQQQGVREARAYGEPLYQQALDTAAQQHTAGQAALAPYAQQGGQSLTALSTLLGLPAAPASAVPASKAVPAQGVPLGVLANQRTPAYPRPSNDTMRQVQQATGLSYELAVQRGLVNPTTGALTPTPGGATSSSYVTLRAPNGQTQAVPADQVDFYLARGAMRG